MRYEKAEVKELNETELEIFNGGGEQTAGDIFVAPKINSGSGKA